MKKFIIFAIIICFSHSLLGQGQRWEVFIGLPNRNDLVEDLIESYDGGYYLEGSYYTTIPGIKGWNAKTDINGNILWQNTLVHGNGKLLGYAATMDSLGNRYICGSLFGQEDTDPYWPFITKFNACGEKEWCKILIEPQYIEGVGADILINANDEVVILVRSKDQNSDMRTRLVAFSSDGDLLWSQSYLNLNTYWWLYNAIIYSMIEHNNEYYLTGDCYWPNPNNPNVLSLRALFIGVDSMFNEKWILPFDYNGDIKGMAFQSVGINDSTIMGVGFRFLASPNMNSLIVVYDKHGNTVSSKQILNEDIGVGIDFNVLRHVVKMNDSAFISPVYLGIGGQTYFGEIIYDTSGVLLNHSIRDQYSGNGRITKTLEGHFVIAVPVKVNANFSSLFLYKVDENLQSVPIDTTTYNYDSLCPNPINSGVINMSDCMVWVGTESIPTPKEYYSRISAIPITIYPNPAKDHITFALENTEHHRNIELRCFNLLGMQQHQTKILRGQQQSSANVSNWPPGMYIAVVYSDGKPVGRGKFVVQR